MDPSYSSTDPPVHIHIKTVIVVVAITFIYFAQLVSVVGAGVLAQPISKFFNSTADSNWFSLINTIVTAALNLPLSQAADYWGRKWILVISNLLGFAGCMIVGRANNIAQVLGGFVVLSISAGSQSSLFSVVSEVVPRKHRPWAQAVTNIGGGLGAVIGLAMGGALLKDGDLENYRIYFYVTAGVLAAGALGCAFFYNPPPRESQLSLTHTERFRGLDWIGYGLFASGLTLFCVALGWSQNPYNWGDAHILATFIIGIVLIISFIVFELFFKTNGMLHHELFKSRNFCLSFAAIFVEGLSFFTTNNYFTFEVSIVTQDNLLIACTHFSITFISTLVFAALAASYSKMRRSVRTPMVAGFTGLLVFNILMACFETDTPKSALWGYPIFSGLALGSILPISMVAAQLSTPRELIAAATGLMISVRALGAAIGLAINNAIFTSALSKNLGPKIAAATLPLGLPPSSLAPFIGALAAEDFQALESIPGVNPQIIGAGSSALTHAYVISFSHVWIAASAFSFVAVVATLFLKDPQSEFNNHIDAPAEKELLDIQTKVEAPHDVMVTGYTKEIAGP